MPFKERSAIVLGDETIAALSDKKIAVFGLGGVGAAAAMDLVRIGVGTLYVIDFDDIMPSNLNRLIFGFADTVGMQKVDVLREFGRKINPHLEVVSMAKFMTGESISDHIPDDADFYIDAIDSLNPKINLIAALIEKKKPFISSMGTGGRMDPTALKIMNIWDTAGCPLAYMVRKRLRKRGVFAPFDVIFSDEPPADTKENLEQNHDNMGRVRRTQGSTPFVPQTAGHFAAFYAVKSIMNQLKRSL